MSELLALLNALTYSGVTIEVVGANVAQRAGPRLSPAAIEQVSRHAAELATVDALAAGEPWIFHGVLGPADFAAFASAVTRGGPVAVSSVGGAVALSVDGYHVEILPSMDANTRANVTSLVAQRDLIGWEPPPVFRKGRDLKVAATVLAQAGILIGRVTTVAEALGAAGETTPSSLPSAGIGRLAYDVRAALKLASIVDAHADTYGLRRVLQLEEQVHRVLQQATAEGLEVDRARLESLVTHNEHAANHHDQRVREALGISFSTPKLLARLNDIGCNVGSLQAAELEVFREESPILDDVLRGRAASSIASQFRPWLAALNASADGRLHPTFRGNGETGRISSTAPNVMGMPRIASIRANVIARTGHVLLEADYNASQLRIVADYLGVAMLRELLARGEDLHAWTASKYFGVSPAEITDVQRSFGKVANFAPLYAAGVDRIVEIARKDYGLYLRAFEVEALMGVFFESFPEILQWHEAERAMPSNVLTTPLGRRLWVGRPGTTYNGRLAAPIQAIEADALKTAMVDLDPEIRRRGGRLIMPINDALLFEVPEKEVSALATVVAEGMTRAMSAMISVPVRVDVKLGNDWGSMQLRTVGQPGAPTTVSG